MSLDFMPGPEEAMMRATAIAARRRLFGRAVEPRRVEVVRHIIVPTPVPIAPAKPAPADLAYAPPRVRDIILAVCAKHNVNKADLMSMRRHRNIILCRQECCYELRQRVLIQGRQISLPEIGRHMGGLDHTTVLYSIRKHGALVASIMEHKENENPVKGEDRQPQTCSDRE